LFVPTICNSTVEGGVPGYCAGASASRTSDPPRHRRRDERRAVLAQPCDAVLDARGQPVEPRGLAVEVVGVSRRSARGGQAILMVPRSL
jgi:hypothetical protein